MTRCPNCGNLIEEGWHICWNCQYELPEEAIENTDKIEKPKESDNEDKYVLVDREKIVQAGKQLKMIVKLILYSFLVALLSLILYLVNDDERTFFLGGVFIIAMYIAQLVNLFQAGSDLIKSVQSKK